MDIKASVITNVPITAKCIGAILDDQTVTSVSTLAMKPGYYHQPPCLLLVHNSIAPRYYHKISWDDFISRIKCILLIHGYESFFHPGDQKFILESLLDV